jgi:hypothetical protein
VWLCSASDAHVDFAAKRPKIDRLSQKRLGTALQCLALGFRIAIRRDHDNWNIRSHGLRFGQELQTGHPRHVDVGQDQDNRYARRIIDALKRHVAGLRKVHRKAAGAEIMPELLTEQ